MLSTNDNYWWMKACFSCKYYQSSHEHGYLESWCVMQLRKPGEHMSSHGKWYFNKATENACRVYQCSEWHNVVGDDHTCWSKVIIRFESSTYLLFYVQSWAEPKHDYSGATTQNQIFLTAMKAYPLDSSSTVKCDRRWFVWILNHKNCM